MPSQPQFIVERIAVIGAIEGEGFVFGTILRDASLERSDPVGSFIIVSHGVTIRCFRMQWMHYPWEWYERNKNPRNCSIQIGANFERLDLARLEALQRDYDRRPDDDILEELSLSMSHGTDGSEKIEARHDILMQFLFEGVNLEPLPILDPQREYTHEEKLILFHKAGGAC